MTTSTKMLRLARASRTAPSLMFVGLCVAGCVLVSCAEDNVIGAMDGAVVDRPIPMGDGGDSGNCAAGVDSDGDGLDNATECMLGSDPNNRDTDGDGVTDGQEARYPRVCVGEGAVPQRRPPPMCMTDMECMMGERCRGLNPAVADSDGDGVPDGMEDVGLDGMIMQMNGETDPRIRDTDGDGMPDGMGGLEICRPMGLATVTITRAPMAGIQLGSAPAFGPARPLMGTMSRSGVLVDEAATNVSAVVASVPSMMAADVMVEAARMEMIVRTALGAGAAPVIVGRSITTHEMQPAIQSTYRVTRMTSASALRDAVALALTGGMPMAGPVIGASGEFVVDVTTVKRTAGAAINSLDVIVAIAPRADYDMPARPTSIRMSDLTNATGVSETDKALGFACQVFAGSASPPVDFLFPVDVSPSMGPYQVQIGNTGQRFFADMNRASVDFRVAVLAAQSRPFNFDMPAPGLVWVDGAAPMGGLQMAHRLTVERYMGMAADTFAPYPNNGMYTLQLNEEPIAASIIAYENLSAMPEIPVNRRFRAGAKVVVFMVADEVGTNDDSRYFAVNQARWGMTYADHLSRAVMFFRSHSIQVFGLVNAVAGVPVCDPTRSADMRRCVIVQTGGAFAEIGAATDADVAAAMARVVEAVIGSASPYRLTRSPITSTIKVRVRGMDVPRSRVDGFDYDPGTRSIVFYGATYRPAMGQQIVVSYRVWEGSLG